MKKPRPFNLVDQLIIQTDKAIRTIAGGKRSGGERPSPGNQTDNQELSEQQRKHIAALMRINHTGEVCAQALYQGQALTAQLPEVREEMEQAAREEEDHLAWCEQRLNQLDSRTSYLNPLWYGVSFGVGAIAGKAGDKWSLGFVAETEKQVCKHLQNHLDQLPEEDQKTKAILEQMLEDEAKHAHTAKAAGGAELPSAVRKLMGIMSKVMTRTTYHL